MTRKLLFTIAAAAIINAPVGTTLAAQSTDHPHLHINPRWKECSFQLDASLTQSEWRQFTREGGLVAYFRPLISAKPMGRGKFELSVLQYDTGIDDHDGAWNNTFVHPDSAHWLFEGEGLKFPGLTLRAGLSDRTDLGLYFTKNPGANYGFAGMQLQHNFARSADGKWNASARGSAVSMYGPADLGLTVFGADVVASRQIVVTRWAVLSPYAGVSSYISSSHEKSALVDLHDEHALGAQAMAGVELRLSGARIAAEYNAARVNSISLKVGFGR
ncbi:MAG: hypothetical protein JWO05_2826 [Gemmatimonadetes bacterium]|nr:hypothetical protein [Gemmatimonadota bacterium]